MAEFSLEILRNSHSAPAPKPAPKSAYSAISVIIPLYNAEKFIGECLDSLLAQTFKNFEVIVVDDCSTDNGVKIVEGYLPKFNGRLSLLHTEKNSGGGSAPRNKGLYYSRGEYVFFADSDDSLTKNALAEMYTLAKDFDPEVIYFEKNFEADTDGANIRLVTHQRGTLVERPTFESEDWRKRVEDLLQRDIWGTPWTKFVRRNFLIENDITFPDVFPCEDYYWTLNLLFTAKKFLRAPSAVYFWRKTESSSIRGKETPQQKINLWLSPAVLGLKRLDNILERIAFFRDNPAYRHAVIDFVLKKMFSMSFRATMEIPQFGVYRAIKKEFCEALGDQDVLVPALCTALNTQQKIIVMNQRNYNKFITKTRRRIAELQREIKSLS